jgi:hypothetical protein
LVLEGAQEGAGAEKLLAVQFGLQGLPIYARNWRDWTHGFVGISTHLYAFLKGCKVPKILVPVGREYADRGEFQDGAPPPAFEYMGKKI